MAIVTVNILTIRGREHLLEKCLAGLNEQSYKDFVVNIISEEKPKIIERIGESLNVTHIKFGNKSISLRRHLASEVSRTQYVSFLDDDEVPSRDWLKTLVDTVERYEDEYIAAVSGPVITPLEMLLPSRTLGNSFMSRFTCKIYYRLVYDSKLFEPGQIVYGMPTIGHFLSSNCTQTIDVDLLSTGNILLKKGILSKVNFDINFVRAYEDYDLSLRLKMLGFRLLFNPHAWVVHLSRKKVGVNSTDLYLQGCDEARFVMKHLKMHSLPLHPRVFFNQLMCLSYRIIESLGQNKSEIHYVYGFLRQLKKARKEKSIK